MNGQPQASIVFYDEETKQLKFITVHRREVQAVIDREVARSGGMTIPPTAEDGSNEPLTDEDARRLGGMVMLMQAYDYPEFRARLKLTMAERVNWNPAGRPSDDSL
ncbi:hypothetical protein [Caballeronia sp. ATUFL_M2_KS44]|uniref:hypothetical protein n=1 Tax=Caballeronia sp. ATUFL_M2_KS44 TaxID=2921767 RepID=UPI002028A5AB|nr:hypothetical protein [Caballeronia sp. ATUFL_M2_KS44]